MQKTNTNYNFWITALRKIQKITQLNPNKKCACDFNLALIRRGECRYPNCRRLFLGTPSTIIDTNVDVHGLGGYGGVSNSVHIISVYIH